MKYSIIIPTLNEERLLPNLLNQLNNKHFRSKFDLEIIISDGGSIDKTIEIAQKNCDIVKIHSNKHRQNIAEGRNEGAKLASGDVLVFINADIIFPDIDIFFSFLNDKFINSSYLAMTCNVKVFPEEEILADKLFHVGYNKYFKLLNSLGIGMGRGECQVIWKNVFNGVNGYNKEITAGEDFDLFRRIRKKGRILFASNICVYESPRRYRKLGYSGVTWSWIKNGFSVFLKSKSISKEWEQVR
ncbi:MAG: glycosyltransferase [Ignavibacteriaceae bacterium]